jgi:hypothetical protein
MSRDLRRAALFLWMMPFLAALSRALTASRTAPAARSSLAAKAETAFFTNVPTAERMGRFRAARRSAWRCAFCADLVFANWKTPRLPWI